MGAGGRVLPRALRRRLSDEDWADRRFDYVEGPIAARYLVQTRVVEWWLHGEDMRATNGLGPQWQHWPINLTIDSRCGCSRGRWAVPATTCRDCRSKVDVEGAGEGRWHWGLGSGEVPAGRKKPDARSWAVHRSWRWSRVSASSRTTPC